MKYSANNLIKVTIFLSVLAYLLVVIVHADIFLINKDSYQFLIGLQDQLGRFGENYHLPFYNRIGLATLVEILRPSIIIIRYFNIFALATSAVLVFKILVAFKVQRSLAALLSLIAATGVLHVFISSIVLSDLIAMTLLLFGIYRVIQVQKLTRVAIVAFVLLSLFRVEFLAVLLPIYFYYDRAIGKYLVTFGGAILANALLLLPIANNEWIARQLEILQVHQWTLLIWITVAVTICFVLYKFNDYLVRFSFLGGLVIMLYLLLKPDQQTYFIDLVFTNGLLLFVTAMYSARTLRDKAAYFKTKEAGFVMSTILVFFLVYHSFYFQHLIVILPFVVILLGLLMKTWTNLPWQIGILSFIVLANIFTYPILFGKFDQDLAQYTALIADAYVQEKSLDKNNTLVVTPFPEANYFWTGISSSSSFDNTESKELLIVSFEKGLGLASSNYHEVTSVTIPIDLEYYFYEEGIGTNPQSFYLYHYSR